MYFAEVKKLIPTTVFQDTGKMYGFSLPIILFQIFKKVQKFVLYNLNIILK
jgi:tetrahydromethanopterin S-methyltransferase subunit G